MSLPIGVRAAFVASVAAAISACGDGTGPGESTSALVSITPCAVNSLTPVWFAYRNGDGAWTQLSADPSGKFTFEAAPKASIAYSYPGPESQRVTRIVNATAAELALLGDEPCANPRGSASVAGSATMSAGGGVLVWMANRLVVASLPNGQGTFTLSLLPSTATDLVAVGVAGEDERWIVRRGIVPAGQTLPVLNFGSSEAQVAPFHSVAISGGPAGGSTNVAAQLKTFGGTMIPLASLTGVSGLVSIKALPSALRDPNDVYSLRIQVRDASGSELRYVSSGYTEPSSRQVAFGPAMATGTVSPVTAAPYPRMRAVIASQAEYPDAARASFLESFRAVRVTTTAAYLGGRPTSWELEVPDLTVAGYQKEWGVQAVPLSWEFEAVKGSPHVLEGGLPRRDETVTIGRRPGR